MKRSGTKITAHRAISAPVKSNIKVKRLSPPPKSLSAPKVSFSIPQNPDDVFNLPTCIPEEHLQEIQSQEKISSARKVKPVKKSRPPPQSERPVSSGSANAKMGTRLMSEFTAMEERLNQIEKAIGGSSLGGGDTLSPATPASPSLPRYNPADYVSVEGDESGNLELPVKRTKGPRLRVASAGKPLTRSKSALDSPVSSDSDVRAALGAIRSELDEWRKSNLLYHQTVPSSPVFSLPSLPVISRSIGQSEVTQFVPTPHSDSREGTPKKDERKSEFPIDRYLDGGVIMKNKEPLRRRLTVQELGDWSIRKKIGKLAEEAEKKVKELDLPCDPEESASSPSLDESDSCYTEELVKNKFEEVTFKNKKAKTSPTKLTVHQNEDERQYDPNKYKEFIPDVPKPRAEPKRRPQTANAILEGRNKNLGNLDTVPSRLRIGGFQDNKSPEKVLRRDIQNPIRKPNFPPRKTYREVSVNTEMPRCLNTTLVNIISRDKSIETEPSKPYQIQDLPSVNIKPKLTKQMGPVIDIKQSKPNLKKDNVSVVEYIHPEMIHENRVPPRFFHRPTSKSSTEDSIPKAQPKSSELKLQRSLRLLLKKLDSKPEKTELKNATSSLLRLLNEIIPFHTASIKIENENLELIEDSIDLFFTNMDIVQELIDNELMNPEGKFCSNPEYIIRAINLLSGNIRSIFNVSSNSQTIPRPSINTCFGARKSKQKENLLETASEKPNKFSPPKRSETFIISSPSQSSPPKVPKELYIPYRKLVPGGLYKNLEKANNSAEEDLRAKRLQKIIKINQELKAQITSSEGDTTKTFSDLTNSQIIEKENVQDLLNTTYVIESENEKDKKEFPGGSSEKKSEKEYDDDWEQEIDTSNTLSETHQKNEHAKISVEAEVYPYPKNDVQDSHKTDNLEKSSSDIKENMPSEARIQEKTKISSIGVQTEELTGISAEKQRDLVDTKGPDGSNSIAILRMTNPLTKALLEVRLPEQTDKFQSSVVFQKTESKEEIKVSYNTNHGEIEPKNSQETCETCQKVEEGTEAQTENQNELEQIAVDFINFIENKVADMVSKFRSVETSKKKSSLEKFTIWNANRVQRTSSDWAMKWDLLHKSTSSLYDKNIEKSESRGRTPETGKNFESLTSPPLKLELKKDVLQQTDFIETAKADACVGSSSVNDRKYENERLTVDKSLRLSSPSIEEFANLSQSRLLPLPEDIFENNGNPPKSQKTNTKVPNVQWYENADQNISLENSQKLIKVIEQFFKSSKGSGSLMSENTMQFENLFLSHPQKEEMDSQRTSQILNSIPASPNVKANVPKADASTFTYDSPFQKISPEMVNEPASNSTFVIGNDAGETFVVDCSDKRTSTPIEVESNQATFVEQQAIVQEVDNLEEPVVSSSVAEKEAGTLQKEEEAASTSLCSSEISEEPITIQHYDSDEMSDGEVRFVYTSNSYSSGEIKPIIKVKNVSEVLQKDGKIDNQIEPLTSSSQVEGQAKVEEVFENVNLPKMESSSMSESFSSGDLQHLLDSDEKSDETALKGIIEAHLQTTTTNSSPETQSNLNNIETSQQESPS